MRVLVEGSLAHGTPNATSASSKPRKIPAMVPSTHCGWSFHSAREQDGDEQEQVLVVDRVQRFT